MILELLLERLNMIEVCFASTSHLQCPDLAGQDLGEFRQCWAHLPSSPYADEVAMLLLPQALQIAGALVEYFAQALL